MTPSDPPVPPGGTDPRLVQVNEQLLLASLEATERAQQLDALLASLHDGVVVLDRSGNVTRANAPARKLFRWRPSAIPLSRTQLHRVLLRRLDGTVLPFEQWPFDAAAAGHPITAEYLFAARNQPPRRVAFSGSTVRDSVGRVSCAIVVCRDVTEIRELERIKQEYAALISHDLRSPLHTISLIGEMLQSTLAARDMPAEAARAGIVVQSALEAGRMVDDLLQASHLRSGEATLRTESVSLSSLVVRVARQLDPQEDRISTALPQGPSGTLPCEASVDGPRIERALTNLITNALKYSERGAPVAVQLSTDDDEAIISVSDRGIGIAPGAVGQLFDQFYRVNRGDAKGGFGLGLYIAHQIVKAHLGRLWVESELGVGSTFHLSLPLSSARQ